MAAVKVRLLWYIALKLLALPSVIDTSASEQNVLCPSSCSCLGSLVDCSRRGLIDVPKDLPVWVEILDLQNNDITTIPNSAFDDLNKLKELDLGNNQIRSLNFSTFRNLTKLKELKLQHNHLTDIPDVGPLPNLIMLAINNNEIFSINSTSLENFPNLRILDMNFNRIVDIPVGTFPNSSKLLHLYLSNNRIVNLEKGSFDNLTFLESLKLNKNRLSNIPKDLFRHLRCLKYLELNRNKLKQIEGLSFHGLESLEVLKLRSNSINHLLDGAFWGLTNIQILHLDHNNISKITKGWLYGLSSLQHLSLSHNVISEVEEDGWEFCKRLTELDLSYNHLQMITKETLKNLHTLKKLYLDHNDISYIEEGSFRSLASLQVLELNNNEISWSVEDTNGAFYGMEKLKHLGLSHNHIKSIAKRAFVGLPRLTTLDLTQNPITSIQENSFIGLKRLHELRFNSTSLLCDCSLRWLPEWLISIGFKESVSPKCGHPEWLKDKTIYDAKPENFTCDDFPKPYMTQQPQTQIALKGENVTLVCKAASSSTSPTTFQWRKDNKLLLDSEMENFATAGEEGITEYSSLLHINSVQDQDEGRYQCVISNQFGSVYSQKARITVHVFPIFTKTPGDITVKVGSTARLECAAKGQPAPQIAWKKDGGDDFPAARERRMHVMPSDDVFFIVSVKASDMGTYSCTAENAAGVIMANATLTVLETPAFVRPMKNKETRSGETAVLECMASGSPKPKLTWSKDGGPLSTTERHFFTADNQLLIIVQTQPSDSGEYSCEMSNTLGTERDSSSLTILPANTSGGDSNGDEENTTTGLIIIAVVCCVVGTSLVWVIIIYQTRKRGEDYSPTNTDETTLPGELPPFTAYPPVCTEDFKGSVQQIFMDSNSESSSKDSGTGDSAKRSSEELLPQEMSSHNTLVPTEKRHISNLVRGSSISSLSRSPIMSDNLSLNSVTNSGCNFQRSSISHKLCSKILNPVRSSKSTHVASSDSVTVEVHSQVPHTDLMKWPLVGAHRSYSVENFPVAIGKSEKFCLVNGIQHRDLESRIDVENGDDIERDSGFATFPRSASPASCHSWSTGSLRFQILPNAMQNDSGSFSIISEDSNTAQENSCQPLSNSLNRSGEVFKTTHLNPIDDTNASDLIRVA